MLLFAPVKTGKVIISFLLLLTYVIGFTHTLLPHHQEVNTGEQLIATLKGEHHHHRHHEHNTNVEDIEDHQHISHENHFDTDFLDLVICFISEVEHPENDCNLDFYVFAKPELNSEKNGAKVRFVAVYMSLLNLGTKSENTTEYRVGNDIIYQSPPIDYSPTRGPPSLV